MIPTKTNPDKALPNIRIAVEMIGDHMVTRLIGRNITIGSI